MGDAPEIRTTRLAVYALVFVAFVDIFAMLPTVSPYAVSLGAGSVGVGVAVGAYSASNLVFNLVGGALLDRVGRRRVLLWGLGLAAVAVATYAAAGSPSQLVAVRLFHGAAGGLLVPAVFTVGGDLAPAQGGGQTMGRVGVCIGLAAVVAPALAGLVRQAAGVTAVFVGVAVVMTVGLALTAATVREPPAGGAHGVEGTPLWRLLRRADLQVALGSVVALTFGVGALAGFLPLHAEALTAQPAVTGMLFTAYAVVASAAMLSPLARSVDVRGPLQPLAAGLAALAVGLAVLAGEPGLVLTVFAVCVFGFGFGLVFPAVAGFLAGATRRGERGRAFGLFNAAFSLGLATGPPVSGALHDAAGVDVFLPAVVISLAGVAFTLLRRRALATA